MQLVLVAVTWEDILGLSGCSGIVLDRYSLPVHIKFAVLFAIFNKLCELLARSLSYVKHARWVLAIRLLLL